MKRLEEKFFKKKFPVEYNGKKYYEKDCDDIFLAAYISRVQLDDENGVYLADGMWVYPDGSMIDTEEY